MQSNSASTTIVALGSVKDVTAFWTFPNNTSGVDYFPDQTIENTVAFFLNDSMRRDGIVVDGIKIQQDGDSYNLYLSGADVSGFAAAVDRFVSAGMMALKASRAINARGVWNPLWRFMLPVGLAMVNHRCVELLHFPPEYVLERDRDYLLANTIIRWGECLVLNGADSYLIDQYQTTIDIAPVGASSNAGSAIEEALGDYSDYSSYINTLLFDWTQTQNGAKPLVAFGSPVRRWLHQTYLSDQTSLRVLDAGVVTISGRNVPFAIANHPSFFYNVIEDKGTIPPPNYDQLAEIMRQDLIVARWQVLMSENPVSNPVDLMQDCIAYYDTQQGVRTICEQVYIQGFDMDKDTAGTHCSTQRLLGTEQQQQVQSQVEALRQTFGANDGNEAEGLRQFAARVLAARKQREA